MPVKFTSLLGLCVAAWLLAPAGASAATLPVETAKPAIAHGDSGIAKVDYREHRHRWHGHHRRWDGWRDHRRHDGGYGRCRAWRHECASRWGWGGHGYHRCLWRHGC